VCRSIKTLRPPYVEELTRDDVHAAALQYVRKVAGMRQPSAANAAAFDAAVEQVAATTHELLSGLKLRTPRPPQTAAATTS
jgi:hypothetical protein